MSETDTAFEETVKGEASETAPVVYRATFDAAGLPTGFYPSNFWPTGYPEDAIVIMEGQWLEFINFQGERRWDGENVVPYAPPPPPRPPISLSAETLLFERMTSDEYDALDASIAAGERANVVRVWRNARIFTEGTDLWALVVKHLTPDPANGRAGVDDARRAEILRP